MKGTYTVARIEYMYDCRFEIQTRFGDGSLSAVGETTVRRRAPDAVTAETLCRAALARKPTQIVGACTSVRFNRRKPIVVD